MSVKSRTVVIGELLTGATIGGAAAAANVTPRTVFRWLEEEAFLDELHTRETQVLNAVSWRLVALSKKALDSLENVIDFPAQAGALNKRLASVALLELALRYRDSLEFEGRIRALERQVLIDN